MLISKEVMQATYDVEDIGNKQEISRVHTKVMTLRGLRVWWKGLLKVRII